MRIIKVLDYKGKSVMDFPLFIRYLQIFGNYKKLRRFGAY
nr:MAG TPA: hypothetical protein [Caudoviricetes sp.]